MIQRLLVLILVLGSTPCFCQDSLIIERYDTIHLNTFLSKKIVVYKYNEVSFILDFYNVKKYTIELTKRDYMSNTAEYILKRLEKEISVNDTAYLDQTYFLNINWIPFNDFLCQQLDEKACLIRDSEGIIHNTYIAARAIRGNSEYYFWGGVLYFIQGQNKSFIEKTIWIS